MRVKGLSTRWFNRSQIKSWMVQVPLGIWMEFYVEYLIIYETYISIKLENSKIKWKKLCVMMFPKKYFNKFSSHLNLFRIKEISSSSIKIIFYFLDKQKFLENKQAVKISIHKQIKICYSFHCWSPTTLFVIETFFPECFPPLFKVHRPDYSFPSLITSQLFPSFV